MAQGNARSVTVKKLQVGIPNLINMELDIRHRHVWKWKDPFGHEHTTVVYDDTNHFSANIDITNLSPDSVTYKVDTPVGHIKFNIADIAKLIMTLAA